MKTLHYWTALCVLAALAAAQSTGSLSEVMQKAEAGDPEAQFQLARAYEDGKDVVQDDESAAKWYRKSAEQGNAKAQNSFGVMYSRGRGVPRDKAEALRWYRKAAQQGLREADFNIAVAYYNGEGVDSDLNRAYAWMMIAKRNGSDSAEQGLVQISQDLNGRFESGTMLLAGLYEKGEETPKDLKVAFETYLQLANSNPRNNGVAEFKICQFYSAGKGVSQDAVQARSWCKTAAKNGIPGAMVLLGDMAENGLATEKNLKEAARWYGEAISYGYSEGFMCMGRLKLQSGSHDDQRDAYFWFYLASNYKIRGAWEQLQKAAANLSSDEITKEQKRAEEWRKKPHWKSRR